MQNSARRPPTLGPSRQTWASGPPLGSYETTSTIAIIISQLESWYIACCQRTGTVYVVDIRVSFNCLTPPNNRPGLRALYVTDWVPLFSLINTFFILILAAFALLCRTRGAAIPPVSTLVDITLNIPCIDYYCIQIKTISNLYAYTPVIFVHMSSFECYRFCTWW